MNSFPAAALDLLKSFEHLELSAYRDQKKGGRWTIGWGHTGTGVHEGIVWSLAMAEEALSRDLYYAIKSLTHIISQHGIELPDERFGALVVFIFNIGITQFLGSTALHDLLAGKLGLVPGEMMRWDYEHDASGVPFVCQGLVNRRTAEVALWNSAPAAPEPVPPGAV